MKMKSKLNAIPPMIYIDYYGKWQPNASTVPKQRQKIRIKPEIPRFKGNSIVENDNKVIYYYNNENNICNYMKHLKKNTFSSRNSMNKTKRRLSRNVNDVLIDDVNYLLNPLEIHSLSMQKTQTKSLKNMKLPKASQNQKRKIPVIIDKYFQTKNNREIYNKLLNVDGNNNRYIKPKINIEEVIINHNANKKKFNRENLKVKSYYFKQSLMLMNNNSNDVYNKTSYDSKSSRVPTRENERMICSSDAFHASHVKKNKIIIESINE